MINPQDFSKDCLQIRKQSPLIHNITNYVAANFAANSLLAIGASPLMSFYENEMEDIAKIGSCLVVNIGCLDRNQIAGMMAAANAYSKLGKPWVLDPVGVGASKERNLCSMELIRNYHPNIIRANASEIMILAGEKNTSKGVDSTIGSKEALDAAISLSKMTGAVVSMSGETDYICKGDRVETIKNGSQMMPCVTAMGCTASSITGAFAAVNPDYFTAALNAMAIMGVAGELAAKISKGSGSLAINFIDELYNSDAIAYSKLIRQ